jgi:hypothetical protein
VLSAGALLKNLICASREANTALQAKPFKVRLGAILTLPI